MLFLTDILLRKKTQTHKHKSLMNNNIISAYLLFHPELSYFSFYWFCVVADGVYV